VAACTYSNSIGYQDSIKITDMSGIIFVSRAAITVTTWDISGISIAESGIAAPLTLHSNGTTAISGTNLAARFPGAAPAL
jgi:hypothetical protein